MRVPLGGISIICPDQLFSIQGLSARVADREVLNAVSIERANGETVEHDLHGRKLVGTGQQHNEFRGQSLPGEVVAGLIESMGNEWLFELVKVVEPNQPKPKSQVQFKPQTPDVNLEGEIPSSVREKILETLRKKNLNIRGFFLNEQDEGMFAWLVLGPDHCKGPKTSIKIIIVPGGAVVEF